MIRIYIMRHGEAGYSALSDFNRSLTAVGQQQCHLVGRWFKQQNIMIDLALISPYVRAQQTYAIVSEYIRVNKMENCPFLTPDSSAINLVNNINMLQLPDDSNVFLVSHLPLVGYLVNELCPHITPPMFSPADVACISLSFDSQGQLEWFHRPL